MSWVLIYKIFVTVIYASAFNVILSWRQVSTLTFLFSLAILLAMVIGLWLI